MTPRTREWPDDQLESTLCKLTLGRMLDTLDARLAQTRAGELDHAEFLQVLREDEIARRAANVLGNRIKRAYFEEPHHPGGVRLRLQPKIPVAVGAAEVKSGAGKRLSGMKLGGERATRAVKVR